MKLLNYTLKEILFDSYKTTIFRAIDDSSGKSVVLKKKDIFNSVNGYVSLKKEYELLQKIKSKSFLNVIDFIETDNENFLVFEDIGGISLKRLMLEQKISLSTFCKIAIDITTALTDIHNSGYIHRDISITNIIWSEALKKAKLIDLNLAVKNTSLLKLDSSKDYIVGTLSYISPEQTGRINYSIDFRSDLYSLGIVFYEILSGHLPFISNSEIELIHSHIALEAKPLHLVKPDLPITLSKIVAKLMAKNPDDRYQTALGLLNDLQKFSEALLHENNDEFILGEKDFSGFLQFPQKLYDRDIEKTQIKLAYEKIDSQTKSITIVKGQPGVGKTYFIERFGNYVNQNHGRFLSGRFSINTKNVPYSGIKEVLSDYVYRIFSEGTELIEIKRKKINEAIGKNGKVLTDILPELEELIGKQPGVEPLEGIMAENRFNYALKQLLLALIEPNNVSVVFLDDLQHIDSASLKILQFLLANADINGLMIILAYRENEIPVESTLFSFLSTVEKNELSQLIQLQPISKDVFSNYLADTFNIIVTDKKFEAFSNEIFNKTLGNPYFSQELITNLYDNDFIKFDFKHNKWIWDFHKIKSFAIAKNVADLLLLKINKNDKKLTDLLKIAACIGEKFDSDILYKVAEIPIEEAQEITEKAISSKLIFEYESEKYRFIHPDIYREYLKDIDSTPKKQLDFKIGTYINQNTPHLIFKILEHYNACNDLFTTYNQQIELAKLNLKAGEKSISLIAYDIAFEYFETAIEIVKSSYWKSDYSFMLELYTLSAETSYLCTNYKRCGELVDHVLNNAQSIHDKTRAYLSKIKSLISRSKYDEALELGISVLKFLGVNRLGLPQWVLLIKELLLSFKNIYNKDISELMKFEKKADANSDAIFQICKYSASAAFHTGSSMVAYLCFKSLNLISTKKIQFEDTHYSLISYGMLIAHTFGNIKKAKQISMQVENYYFNEKFNHLIQKTAVINYHMINHLHRPIATGIQPFFENFERSLAHGDVEFAANSIMLHAYYIFWAGGPFSELQQAINKSAKELKALNFLTFYYCIKSLQQFVQNQTTPLNFAEVNIEGTYYKESRMVLQHQNNHDITSLNTVYYLKLMQNVLFENYPEAYKAGLEVKKYMKANYGTPTIPLIQMYFSISIAKVYASLSNEERRNTKSFFKSSVKKLKKLSIFAPENYLHKYLLLKALYSENIAVNLNKAAVFYSKAVNAVKKSNISNEIALTYELAAKYLIKNGNSETGEIYLFNAWKQYKNWGGKAKATQLYQQYGKIIKQFITKHEYDTSQSLSGEISQEGLDIESIIKASQMISEELKIKELQEKLIRVVMQNAGAQKGVLIGIKDNELYVLTANGDQIEAGSNSKMLTNNIFPQALASYVYRNSSQCVFDNLSREKRFNTDNYVIKNKPKSVVCSPILFKQKVQGIIYLENNLLEGAFNPAHVSIINLLSSQIAISLENAQLYENLEAKVKQRTLELNVANRALKLQNKKVEELYQSVTDSIQSAYRIQQAMLPPKEILQQNLKDFFILFKPRNVVSGDFYWYKKEQDKLYIAAADCTGHGVPGAFMSILGILLLNDIIVAHPKIKASEILERLRELIKISLKQTLSSNSLSDGIDIAFCVVDTNTKVLEYSGAYNPLFLMRNNELVETKATRNPVGIYLKEMPFVNHEIALEPNDKIYLFSDGFIDQMGGPKGYKFMTQKFKTLLMENHHKPMAEQAKIYEKTFERWKGEAHDQTDDVLLIGFEYF